MYKIYQETEIYEIRQPLRTAKSLRDRAGKIQSVIKDQLGKHNDAEEFEVSYQSSSDVPLDFFLSTPLGIVFAQFDFVRLRDDLVGRYTFFYEDRDEQSKVVRKPIFAFLFRKDGRVQFGERSKASSQDDGFAMLDAGFTWHLVGNLLKAIYAQFDEVRSASPDIKDLLG